MERRLTITYTVSAAATICAACVAIGAVFGSPFAQARPAVHSAVDRLETVDDYIVVPSPPTTMAPSTAPTIPVIDHASIALPVAAPAPADTTPLTTVVTAVRAADASIPAPVASSPSQPPSASTTPPADPASDDGYSSHERHYSDGSDSNDGDHEEGDD